MSLLQREICSKGLCSNGAPVKKLILEEVYKGVLKLECFTILKVLDAVVSKVASTVAIAEKMQIRVKWIDKVIGEIGVRRDHFELLRVAWLLRIKLEKLQE